MEIITTHVNADFDAFASMIAAKKLYPDARLIFPGTQEETLKEFIAFTKGAIPIEMEKDLFLDEDVSKLIIVETRSKDRLGKVSALLEQQDMQIITYDHHPPTAHDIKAQKNYYGKYGATATLLTKILKRKKISPSPLEATILALGIYEDTGSLSFPSTTKDDVDTVSYLLSCGADLNVVREFLHRSLSPKEMNLLTDLMKRAEVVKVNGFSIVFSAMHIPHMNTDCGTLVHRLLEIENYDAGFVLLALSERKTLIIARSKTPFVNVRNILKCIGKGGGHLYAASCNVRTTHTQYLQKRLLQVIRKKIKVHICAKDIMHTPLKTVSVQSKVDQVKEMMDAYALDYVTVVKNTNFVGVLSRSDIEKAVHHGFGHSHVKGYILGHPHMVTPHTSLYMLESLIKKDPSGYFPVLKGKKSIGYITAYDVFLAKHRDSTEQKDKGKLRDKMMHDYTPLLKNRLPRFVFRMLCAIGKKADQEGVRACIVGGFVRDIFMKRKNLDVDILVEKKGIRLAELFAQDIHGALVRHQAFGTAKVTCLDGLVVDFATARTEFYEKPAALPVVSFSSLKQDLLRRDFSVNAMAISLNKKTFGRLFDFYHGLSDIRSKKIRVLHSLSFIDDPTRIFRAIRFEQRLGFRIEPHTAHLIKTATRLNIVGQLEKQRMREELKSLLQEENPINNILRMRGLSQLRSIHPRLKIDRKRESLLYAIRDVGTWYQISMFKKRHLDLWLMYLMGMVDGLSLAGLNTICDHFVFTRGDAKRLLDTKVYEKKVMKNLLNPAALVPSRLYRVLEPLSYETILFYMAKYHSHLVRKRIEDFFLKYNGIKVHLTGKDLKNVGLVPGPVFKKILEQTLYAKLDHGFTAEAEKVFALRYAQKLVRTFKDPSRHHR